MDSAPAGNHSENCQRIIQVYTTTAPTTFTFSLVDESAASQQCQVLGESLDQLEIQ